MAKSRGRTRNPQRHHPHALAEGKAELQTVPAANEHENESPPSGGEQAPGRAYAPPAKPTRRGGFLTIYKRNQGRNTRIGTAAGAGIIIGGLAWFLYDQLEVYNNLYVQTGIAAGITLVLALLGYWLIAAKHRSVDFLIATDSELKKVNWSSKKEVIGSTKVVIATTLLMAIALFVVDIIFLRFFQMVGVWEATG